MATQSTSTETETSIEKRFVELCKRRGWRAVKGEVKGARAWLDRLVLVSKSEWYDHGLVFFIEFKRPGQKPRKDQQARIDWLVEHGFHASWFTDANEAVRWIDVELLTTAIDEAQS